MGGGGGNNSAMMMMMMQQQQAAEARAAAEAVATREFNAKQAEIARQNQLQDTQASNSRADQQAALLRQQQIDDRQHQEDLQAAAQKKIDDAAAAAKQADADKLAKWQANRDGIYGAQSSDAMSRLSSAGISDPTVSAALKSALNNAYSSIPDNASNVAGYFDGIYDRVIGQQTAANQSKFGKAYDKLLPTDFASTKVADTIDDSILEGILGDQYNSGAADAKRLLDRGVITQEGYNANLKDLDTQRTKGRATLTTLGNNELNAERTNLTNIANKGRTALANYQLGDSFDPQSYANQVNSAYDTWFAGLGDKLKGLAPTDLFDTSSFLNTAGRVSGATNSPFVGSTNALTGDNALTDDDDNKKKTAASSGASIGVF